MILRDRIKAQGKAWAFILSPETVPERAARVTGIPLRTPPLLDLQESSHWVSPAAALDR
jgi:hypothetical protein